MKKAAKTKKTSRVSRMVPKPSPTSRKLLALEGDPTDPPPGSSPSETPQPGGEGGDPLGGAPVQKDPEFVRAWIQQSLTAEFGAANSRRIAKAIPTSVLKQVKISRKT